MRRPAPPADCTIHTQFKVFAPRTDASDARAYTQRFNAALMLNERAMIAMFYPMGRGGGCSRAPSDFDAASKHVFEVFQSYAPR